MDLLISSSSVGSAGSFHEYDPPAWHGSTGFYRTDFRSLPMRKESRTWDSIYVWAGPSYSQDTMYFSMLAGSTLCEKQAPSAATPPSDRRYLLKLMGVPDGVIGAPPVGTIWELPLTGLFSLGLPTYRTTNGLEGYRFAFTMTNQRQPFLVIPTTKDRSTGPSTRPRRIARPTRE